MPKIKTHFFYYCLLFLFYAVILARPINLTTQDIGRHIANGRELLSGNTAVLFQNYYSFTMPEEKFVNHHWLFGVIAFAAEQLTGFVGLHIFHILILLVAFWFLLKIIAQETSALFSIIFGLPAILFLSLRTEVRPESIGLLFIGHTLFQLQQIISKKQISLGQVVILLIQQLLWVNIHISFVFSLFLAGLLLITSVLLKSPNLGMQIKKKLFFLSGGLGLLSLANPNFLLGALQPFLIFTDYGYAIVENQTLYFLWRVIGLQTVFPFLITVIIGLALLIKEKRVLSWFEITLYLTGFFLGFYALRNIPIFVFFSLPIFTKLLYVAIKNQASLATIKLSPQHKNLLLIQAFILVIALSLSDPIMPSMALSRRKPGLLPNQNLTAEYVKENNLQGPIFNNYDLGSYLIYHLPDHKVFTDNRPEAYNQEFFQKIYIPMQDDPDIWQEQQELHQFQTIIFGVQDITPAAINFLSFISQNPEWEPAYQDNFIGVWTRKAR